MDNLAHSLAGALLGQMGLKRLTGRAMATLIIAANLPDIDAFATFLGTESLAVRRGITHGPIALLILPAILTGLVLAWDRWRPSAQPVRPAAVLLLAYIGTLSHPALDWLNSYGIRFLEPFSSRWFYGDTLFIIDVWLWAALIAGLWISRRRERRGRSDWQWPAAATFVAVLAYVGFNGLFSMRAEAWARHDLAERAVEPTMVVAQPQPFAFWTRRILWRTDSIHGDGEARVIDGLEMRGRAPNNLDHPALAAALDRPDVNAFLFWSRMPIVVERNGNAYLTDQRMAGRPPRPSNSEATTYSFDPFTVPLDSGGGTQ